MTELILSYYLASIAGGVVYRGFDNHPEFYLTVSKL